ncbi:hypothetical protein ACN4EK_14060 [Pantanalinema rosaneae CENA516]|uniref:hypothetical protein n=1 Tax=Pantanalinema rosaneae TaxID=1620701 RepID=UPI003D6F378A
MQTPVVNAQVQIYDLDQGGNGNDKIYEGKTNGNGEFSGLSQEWIDRNTIRFDTPFGPFTQEVPDIMALEFRVVVDGQAHKGPYFHVGDNRSVPIVMPITPPVTKTQREVIHLITLSEAMDGANKLLYEAVEMGASLASNTMLGPNYGKVHLLEKDQATLSNLCHQLEQVAAKSSVKAVDLLISPHGLNNRIYFYPNEGVAMAMVADKLKSIPEMYRRKFRMVFSTACYGASHIDEWLDGGFQVASGSEKIYADSLLSFPAFLGTWVLGGSFQEAINAANAADPLRIQDRLASAKFDAEGISQYAKDVNSYRRVGGNGNLHISSLPA